MKSRDLLSPRLRQIYDLLIEDIPLKEISFRLGLSENTARVYAFAIYKRFGLQTRIGLIHHHYKEYYGIDARRAGEKNLTKGPQK